METKKDNYLLEKFLLSVFFTAFAYLLSNTDIKNLHHLAELVGSGVPKLRHELVSAEFWSNFTLLPVIVTWAIIGITFYFLYYFLNITYTDLSNWMTIKTKFTNQECDDRVDIRLFKRFTIHALVAIFYSMIICSIFFFFFPLAENLRETYFELFKNIINTKYVFVTSYSLIFIYWFSLFYILHLLLQKVTEIKKEEEILEEHIQIK